MKYINQLEYPHWLYVTRTELEGMELEKGKTTTIRSSGCGLCAAVTVADRLLPNSDFELKDALELSYEVEANHIAGTNYARFAPAFADKLGLDLEMTDEPERLLFCLRTGGAAVALVNGDRDGYKGVFSHGLHYVAVIGIERDGRIAVLDPSYKPGKYDEEGRAGKVELKNDVIALCSVEVLTADGADCAPPFYLFWRK